MIKPQRIDTQKTDINHKEKIDISVGKIEIDEKNILTEENEDIPQKEKKNNNLTTVLILSALSAFLIGSIYDIYYRFLSIFQNTPYLGFLYILSILIFTASLFFIALKQYQGYRNLKEIENRQEKARKLSQNPTKEVFSFAKEILSVYINHPNEKIRQKALEIEKEIEENIILKDEVLDILEEKLFKELDNEAYKLISKYSNQTALSTAISPVALIDVILILSRSWAMISQISKVYGFKPNFTGKMILLKKVSLNLIFASVTDLASDYLSSIIGTSLLSKLSYHSAQGLANGVLIARIGVATIKSCRVIYFRKRINYVEYIAKKLLETLLGRAQAKS